MPDTPPTFGNRKPTKRKGGSVAKRDNSAAYKKQRLAILARHPLCVYCRYRDGAIVPATILDHLLSLSLGGSNDPANLVPACKTCNDDKAVAEMRYLAKGYDIASVRFDPELSKWFRLATKQ